MWNLYYKGAIFWTKSTIKLSLNGDQLRNDGKSQSCKNVVQIFSHYTIMYQICNNAFLIVHRRMVLSCLIQFYDYILLTST